MEASQKRVFGLHRLFPGNIRQADGIEREYLVLRDDHRDCSGNILCVDKLLYRRANGGVPGFRSKSGRRQEQ